MESQATRKRPISSVLNDASDGNTVQESGGEPPRSRPRLNKEATSDFRQRSSGPADQVDETSRPPANLPEPRRAGHPNPASLAYPDLANSKPTQVAFQKPSQLTSFSYTPEHVQEFTDSALRYFVDPPLGANLGYGYERWNRKPDTRGRIDALLKAISRVKKDLAQPLPEIGVVSWRGVMTKILTAPYENREGWDLNVMYSNGTLYFEEHTTEERLNEKNNMSPRQRSQTYYGYAFESYCTSEAPVSKGPRNGLHPGAPPGWGGDVNTNVQWCSVVRTKLGDTRMIIGGEVDCARGKYTGQTDTFVELKTSLTIRGQQDEAKFERKLLKFYFQSFLLGVPEIVVGFRTPAGVVTTVQSFKTIQLPRLVRGKPGAWDPLVCLDWGQRVLKFLKDMARRQPQDENRHSIPVWRVKFVPGSGLSVEELDRAGVDVVENGEDRVGFLPRWYWDEINTSTDAEDKEATASRVPNLASAGWQR